MSVQPGYQPKETGKPRGDPPHCGSSVTLPPAVGDAVQPVGLSITHPEAIGNWIIRHADHRPTRWQQLWHRWLLGWVWEDAKG